MTDSRHPQPGHGRRPLHRIAAALRRPDDLGGQSAGRRSAHGSGDAAAQPRSTRTATCIAGATRRRSSTAPTTQWFAGMDDTPVTKQRRPDAARDSAARASRRPRSIRRGASAPARHDRQPPRLDALAPAPMGRADAVLRPQGNGRAASAHDRAARGRRPARGARRHRSMANARSARADRRRREHVRKKPRHARRLVRLGRNALARAARLAQGRLRISRPTFISKARTSTAAGSTRRC